MYFVKTPKVIQSLLKDVTWNIPNNNNEIYLTFDDGPTKYITEKTLDTLNHYGIKATFFCLGQQVEKNPRLFQRIIKEGHAVGNHSYSHLKGWNTNNEEYIEDINKAKSIINSNLFRPPYGKAKRGQLDQLKQFKTIMWDVLPGDFSPKNNIDSIVSNTLNHVEVGSIIVLHDNDKCGEKMNQALPVLLEELKNKGFNFGIIS